MSNDKKIPFYPNEVHYHVDMMLKRSFFRYGLLYLIICMVVSIILNQFALNSTITGGISLVCGVFITTMLYCNKFSNKEKRIFSQNEYRRAYKGLFFAFTSFQLLAVFAYLALILYLQSHCQQNPTLPQCQVAILKAPLLQLLMPAVIEFVIATAIIALLLKFNLAKDIRVQYNKLSANKMT